MVALWSPEFACVFQKGTTSRESFDATKYRHFLKKERLCRLPVPIHFGAPLGLSWFGSNHMKPPSFLRFACICMVRSMVRSIGHMSYMSYMWSSLRSDPCGARKNCTHLFPCVHFSVYGTSSNDCLFLNQLCMGQKSQHQTWMIKKCVHWTMTGWWYTYPSEKYEFVSWDHIIPNIMGKSFKIPNGSSHHQSAMILFHYQRVNHH